MTKHYFAGDGNYGDATGLVFIDTTDWAPGAWEYIDILPEGMRAEVAEDIAAGRGVLDEQECPGFIDDACSFKGYVYINFFDPARKQAGGYAWDCPECEANNAYEGDRFDGTEGRVS